LLPHGSLAQINAARAAWFPDGKRFLLSGNEAGRGPRLYVQDIAGGNPQAITPEGVDVLTFSLSPGGQKVAAVGADGKGYFYPIPAGEPTPIKGVRGRDGLSPFLGETLWQLDSSDLRVMAD